MNPRWLILGTIFTTVAWGGYTVAAHMDGMPLGRAALYAAGLVLGAYALAALVIAAVMWAARGDRRP